MTSDAFEYVKEGIGVGGKLIEEIHFVDDLTI